MEGDGGASSSLDPRLIMELGSSAITTSDDSLQNSKQSQGNPSPVTGSGRNSESTEQEPLSDVSHDSFDWVGDDRRDDQSEEDDVIFQNFDATGQFSKGSSSVKAKGQQLIPVNFFHNTLLVIFVLCSAVMMAKVFRAPMPILYQVSLEYWVGLIFLLVFLPVWTSAGVLKLSHSMRSMSVFSRTEYPARLEAIRFPITLTTCSVIIGLFWGFNFPLKCTPKTLTENMGRKDFVNGAAATSSICLLPYIPRIFFFLFVSGVTLSLNTFIMNSLRSLFQERNFKNRIVENRFKIHVVDQLLTVARQKKSSRITKPAAATVTTTLAATSRQSKFEKGHQPVIHKFMFNLPFLILDQLNYWILNSKSSHSYTRLGLNQGGEGVNDNDGGSSNGFEEFKRELLRTIKTSGYETVAKAPPRSDRHAKIMAKMIFHYLCPRNRKHLTREDFNSIISNEAASKDAYQVFDVDRDGIITKAEFRNAIVRIFKQQRNLAQSVASTGSVLSILETASMWVITAGLLLILLALFGVNVQNILGVTASIAFGLNFIIFDIANETFQAFLFLFVMHPYDVGDRIVTDGKVGHSDEDILTVVHVNIQNTVFRKWNGVYVTTPNHLLATDAITNLSRATEQWERVEFAIIGPDQKKLSVEEETAKLAELRRAIESFLGDYPRDYYQSFELRALIAADYAKSDDDLDILKFFLKVRCRETLDNQKKWIRHARILAFVKQAVNLLNVEFTCWPKECKRQRDR